MKNIFTTRFFLLLLPGLLMTQFGWSQCEVTVTADPETICEGGSSTLTVTLGADWGTDTTLEWQYNNAGTWEPVTNGIPMDAMYDSQGAELTVEGISEIGNYQYRCKVTPGVGSGCQDIVESQLIDLEVVAQPIAPTLNIKTPDLGTICNGTNVSATFNAGSGGVGCSDEYEYRIGNGSWLMYTPGLNIMATNTVEIRGRRTGCTANAGCNETAWSTLATWSVNAQPIAPTLNIKTPNIDTVCIGTNVSATFNAGSGGVGCSDEYEFRIGNGSWLMYTPGSNIMATNTIEIRGSRTGCTANAGCNETVWSTLATWNTKLGPTAPETADKFPNVQSVCEGTELKLNSPASGGNEGVGCTIRYRFSVNGGSSYSFPPSESIPQFPAVFPAGSNKANMIQAQRYNCSGGCDTTSWNTIASWDIVKQPTAPDTAVKVPNLVSVCVGREVTLQGHATGGEQGLSCSLLYRYRINGGDWIELQPNEIPKFNTDSVGITIIEAKRVQCQVGCNESIYQEVATWNVVSQPTAPTMLSVSNPISGATVCVGSTITAGTPSGGSEGVGCTTFEYRFYRNGTPIGLWSSNNYLFTTTIDPGTISVRVRRAGCTFGSGCDASLESGELASWTIVPQPTPPTMLSGTSPSSNIAVCKGATLKAGIPSGGFEGVDCNNFEYLFYRNGTPIGNWSANNELVTTTIDPGTISVRVRRAGCTAGSGCNPMASGDLASWTVVPQPEIINQPQGAKICFEGQSQAISLTATGGTPALTYQWQYQQAPGNWMPVMNDIPSGANYTGENGATGFQVSGISGPSNHQYRCVVNAAGPGCWDTFSIPVNLEFRRQLFPSFTFMGSPKEGQPINVKVEDNLADGVLGKIKLLNDNDDILKEETFDTANFSFVLPNGSQGTNNRSICVELFFPDLPACNKESCSNKFTVSAATDQALTIQLGESIKCFGDSVSTKVEIELREEVNCQKSGSYAYHLDWMLMDSNESIIVSGTIDSSVTDATKPFDKKIFEQSDLDPGRYMVEVKLSQECENDSIYAITNSEDFIILPADLQATYNISSLDIVDLGMGDTILCPDIQYEITGLFADIIFDENIMHSGFNFKSGSQTIKDTLILNASAASMYTIPVEFTVTGGCTYQDTLLLNTRSTYDLRDDISLCMGDSVMLSVAEQFQNVKWQSITGSLINKNGNTIIAGPFDGDSTVIDRVLAQGDREGCRYLDTFDITFIKVEGEIVPWPDTTCDLGLYRVVPGPNVVVDSISIPTGWSVDTFTNYIFKVGELGGGSLGFRLKASGELTCSNTLLFSDPILTPADPISELAYDACAGVLLVPQECADAKGKWFYIDGQSGELQTLEDTSLFAININTTSLKSGRYFFFCDSCGPVSASTRQDPQSTDPCDKNPTFELSLYPNPATTEVYLGLDRAAGGQVYCQITDMLGRQVYEAQWSHPGWRAITRIDSRGWASGYYFLMLRDQSGRRYVEKLIINQ